MTLYFSASDCFFYDDRNSAPIPPDAVEITPEVHRELLEGQQQGGIIRAGADGYPCLEERQISPEVLADGERIWRDGQLRLTDSLVARHRDEQEDGEEPTLSEEHYSQLQTYRRSLRHWPEQPEFPSPEDRPQSPAWLTEALMR